MKKVPITITSVSSAYRGVMFLSKSVCLDLRIKPGLYSIQCGGVHSQVRIMHPMYERSPACSCSPDVIETLALVEGSKLFLYMDNGSIRLGPVLGIFANVRYQNGEIRGQQAPIFEHLLSIAGDERIFAYIFSLQEIDSRQKIRGYIMKKKNGQVYWRVQDVPFPDVVYDQIVSRKFENLSDVSAMKDQLTKKLGASYFNPGFFDKWQVHQWLSEQNSTKMYLPVSIKHQDLQTTASFVEKHKNVYLKPIHGSLGVGIIKILRLVDGRYFYQLKGQNGIQAQGYGRSAMGILKKMKNRFTKRTYIVQEGLHLQTYQGRSFDIRILMQKDGTGKWRRTKAFCRIAQSGDITSNLSTGGDAIPLAKVLRDNFPNKEDGKRIRRKIRTIVNTIPEMMEQVSGLMLGEMGLDIGIDTKGDVWIIEVNSKPWKKPNTDQGSMKIVLESFRRPLLYCKYLSRTM